MGFTTTLSVIIPIYNVEKYLKECLESVLDSMGNLQNIQVILVDDGSLDSSGEIARKFAEAHPNFLYLYKENGGISEARNYGLRYVKTPYVTFIDSDDTVQKIYFEKILKELERQPDLLIFDWLDIEEGQVLGVVKGMDFTEDLWTVQPGIWNKVFKTGLFDHVEFPKGRVYEDVGTTYKLLYYTRDYIHINQPLYKYRKNRKGSILTTVSSNINDIYKALEDTYNFYQQQDAMTGNNRDGLCYQYVKLLCWSNMYRQLRFFKLNFHGFYRKMNETRQLLYNRFPNWKENELLNKNAAFFENRFGNGYINKMDRIGKSYLSTLYTLINLIVKNQNYIGASRKTQFQRGESLQLNEDIVKQMK